MNVSPHHQRPTKYPWPGPASAAVVLLALGLVVLVGFMLLGGSTRDENEQPTVTGTRSMPSNGADRSTGTRGGSERPPRGERGEFHPAGTNTRVVLGSELLEALLAA